jgi:RHS repeat-associated protein
VWEWQSQPFGEGAANENPQNLTGAALTAGQFRYNLRFPGQVYDAETAKHYNYFRDYDPALGRYLESDPIGLIGGINTFGYVRQNALARIDPLGLADFCFRPGWGSGGPGWPHVRVCDGDKCNGFGPDTDSIPNMILGPGTSGPEDKSKTDKCFKLPDCDPGAMNKCILECDTDQPYSVIFNNCAGFAKNCALKCIQDGCKKKLIDALRKKLS